MNAGQLLALGQIVVAAYMTGVIWQVQLLTYPQFALVGPTEFPAHHRAHTRRMAWIVGPPMLAELVLSIAGAWHFRSPTAFAGLLLVLALWTITGLVQVPLHRRLAAAKDPRLISRLVRGNWPRTILWTARVVLLLLTFPG